MKRIILLLVMAISLGSLSAQECTLRLEMPAVAPIAGEDFYVGVYMDVLLYPGYDSNAVNGFLPTLKSGQIAMNYDPAVLTALKSDPLPIPPFSTYWYHDLNAMFGAYGADPAANVPEVGDIRFVSYTTITNGMDPSYFGFVSGVTPLLMWNLKFNYIGGDIAISFQDADKTTKIDPTLSGGVKEKIVSFWTAWDNESYAMTYVNIPDVQPCIVPDALGTSNITATSADVTWNSYSGLSNLEYGLGGFVPTGVPTIIGATSPYSLTGLTASTDYDVYIQDDCSGSTSDWVLTSFTTLPGSSDITWTGAEDDDALNGNNYDPIQVTPLPDGLDLFFLDTPTKAVPTISGGVLTTGTLTIGPLATLNVGFDGGITTNGLFTNDGIFQIQSDLNGYAGSFIDNGGVAGIGTFNFDRDMVLTGQAPNTVNDPFGWHYLASPFDGFTTDDIPDYFVNAWDQGNGEWIQYSNTIPCTPWPTTGLNTLDAWSVNMDNTYPLPECVGLVAPGTGMIVEFSGLAADVHTGPYSTTLGFGAGAYQEWNMVSNPYPSGLNVDAIVWGTNTVQATYFYDGFSGNYVYWATGDGAYPMASTLGFMVETTGAGDAFSVDNTMRVHTPDWFWKSDVPNRLILEATGNDRSDILKVRFANDVTAGFDLNGDAHKLFATTQGLAQIYTTAGDEKLAINALPETSMVPMGFTSVTSGEYKIAAIETSEFSNVVLEDLVTGEQTDLLVDSYSFNYTVNDAADRFMIHFTALGIGDNAAASINIWSNDHKIYVQSPEINGDIVVFNMMGQEVIRTEIEPGLNTIPVNDGNAYYVVKVVGSDVAKTGKVYVK